MGDSFLTKEAHEPPLLFLSSPDSLFSFFATASSSIPDGVCVTVTGSVVDLVLETEPVSQPLLFGGVVLLALFALLALLALLDDVLDVLLETELSVANAALSAERPPGARDLGMSSSSSSSVSSSSAASAQLVLPLLVGVVAVVDEVAEGMVAIVLEVEAEVVVVEDDEMACSVRVVFSSSPTVLTIESTISLTACFVEGEAGATSSPERLDLFLFSFLEDLPLFLVPSFVESLTIVGFVFSRTGTLAVFLTMEAQPDGAGVVVSTAVVFISVAAE